MDSPSAASSFSSSPEPALSPPVSARSLPAFAVLLGGSDRDHLFDDVILLDLTSLTLKSLPVDSNFTLPKRCHLLSL
jgi:hypothetical protein